MPLITGRRTDNVKIQYVGIKDWLLNLLQHIFQRVDKAQWNKYKAISRVLLFSTWNETNSRAQENKTNKTSVSTKRGKKVFIVGATMSRCSEFRTHRDIKNALGVVSCRHEMSREWHELGYQIFMSWGLKICLLFCQGEQLANTNILQEFSLTMLLSCKNEHNKRTACI